MTFERGADGVYRAHIAGRAWSFPAPVGSEAWVLYMSVQTIAGRHGAGDGRQQAQAAVARLIYDPAAMPLILDMVRRMSCDGVHVGTNFDAVFQAERVHEIPVLALEAWEALGFLLPLGMLPAPPAATPTP